MLKRLVAELRDSGIAVYFADVHAPVLERARETGLLEVVADGHASSPRWTWPSARSRGTQHIRRRGS